MATLHLVNKPTAWDGCHPLLDVEDVVLLIEDGTYLAQQALSGATLYALEPDIRARGLSQRIHSTIRPASFDDFVRLVESCERVVTWSA